MAKKKKEDMSDIDVCMKNRADYSQYKCPYSHIEKDCEHLLQGPEGYEDTYSVWCACGFRGPVFILDPEKLRLEKVGGNDSEQCPDCKLGTIQENLECSHCSFYVG